MQHLTNPSARVRPASAMSHSGRAVMGAKSRMGATATRKNNRVIPLPRLVRGIVRGTLSRHFACGGDPDALVLGPAEGSARRPGHDVAGQCTSRLACFCVSPKITWQVARYRHASSWPGPRAEPSARPRTSSTGRSANAAIGPSAGAIALPRMARTSRIGIKISLDQDTILPFPSSSGSTRGSADTCTASIPVVLRADTDPRVEPEDDGEGQFRRRPNVILMPMRTSRAMPAGASRRTTIPALREPGPRISGSAYRVCSGHQCGSTNARVRLGHDAHHEGSASWKD